MASHKFKLHSESEIINKRKGITKKNTKHAEDVIERILRAYAAQIHEEIDLESISKEKLNVILDGFYISCRTQKKDFFKISSLITRKANLRRFIKNYKTTT